MRIVCIALFSLVLSSSDIARAQSDAGLDETDSETDTAAEPAEPAEPALETAVTPQAPAVPGATAASESAHELRTVDVMGLDPNWYPPELRRLIVAKQRELRKLGLVVEREGWSYDKSRERRHTAALATGVVLLVGGLTSLVFSLVNAIDVYGFGWCMSEDGCGPSGDAETRAEVAAWVLLTTGIAEIATGIPLTVRGAKGRSRQRYLRRKDEILDLSPLAGLSVALYPTRDGASGGLAFSGSF